MNTCVRPACLSDVILGRDKPIYSLYDTRDSRSIGPGIQYNYADLERLYNAEWRKRGFAKSP